MAGDQEQYAHGRLLQCQQIVIELQGFLRLLFRNGIDHIEDVVGDASGADRFHILCGDYIPVQTVADQLFQFHLDIFHVRAGFGEQQLCGILGDLFPFFAQNTGDPAFQGILILYREFCHITLGLHGLIQFTPFIHFAFREHKKGGVVGVCQVFRQLFPAGFEEPGVFEKHDTAFCQKRQRLCQIDDLSQGEILPLIEMGIHLVAPDTEPCADGSCTGSSDNVPLRRAGRSV